MASILQVFEQGFFGVDGRDQRVLVTISIPEGIISPKRLSEEWILVLNIPILGPRHQCPCRENDLV